MELGSRYLRQINGIISWPAAQSQIYLGIKKPYILNWISWQYPFQIFLKNMLIVFMNLLQITNVTNR